MKLATTTIDFLAYTDSTEHAMEFCSRAGFRFLDYSFHMDWHYQTGLYSADPAAHLKQIRRKCDALGVSFVQAHSPMIYDTDPQFNEITLASIRACAELGIPNLVIHPACPPVSTKEEAFAHNRIFYQPFLQEAEQYGICILAENFVPRPESIYRVRTAYDLRELVDFIQHPLFRAVWDTGHGNMLDTPADESIRALGNQLRALHIHDNSGTNDAHVAPFFGSMNLDSLMHGLLEIGYNGFFTFESSYFFLPEARRRAYENDRRLCIAPLELRIKAEELLYEIGKSILTSYNCFEESHTFS